MRLCRLIVIRNLSLRGALNASDPFDITQGHPEQGRSGERRRGNLTSFKKDCFHLR